MERPKPEEIAKLAYQFYLEDGKPTGRAVEHWMRAEEFLQHPENHADSNVLSVPSEPELTPALDEKAKDLDQGLPSDPRSGEEAVHQWVEIATGPRDKRRNPATLEKMLQHLAGVERVRFNEASGRVRIYFDARRTNPAAIHEAIIEHESEPAEMPGR